MMLSDPESTWKRPKMMLPSDNELEGIPKMGYATDLLAENEELPEGSAALLAKNSQTPRQGTVAGTGDATVMETENLARLTDSQTHLLGGEILHPFHFSAVTPRNKEIQATDPMSPPSITHGAAAALTPGIGLTPSRDELHLNEDTDMHESEELMTGEKTEEAEAVEDNTGMTLATLKLLCHYKRKMHRNFSDKDFEDENSPTLESARQLFSNCWHCMGKPHLQRMLVGDSQIWLIADRLNSFKTTYIDFESKGTDQEFFRGIYEGIQTHNIEGHSNMFERFTVKLWGPRNEVKSAFEEAIVELRRNCFTLPPQ
ncbi:hypothetical protein Bca52824_037389 [Brassica carinata]|uniref:Uncharacterized protein n=1 Tax=Brassica carinata TaxID=52824 RepID=A0A8X7V3N7_BRACI|nr:hypothetical protein Bca52824_037389 [Brassica carinata]